MFSVNTEHPSELRLNIQKMYQDLNDTVLEECNHPNYKKLLYVLSFFHAVVQVS